MARLFLVLMLISVFLIVGCSENDENAEALGDEAAQDDAAAVMDSLNNEGAVAETEEQGMLAEDIPAEAEPEEVTYQSEADYSSLSGYVVQVGAYSSYDFAKMMSDKYIARDYPAFIVSTEIDGETYYRLRIGVYETLDEAKEVAVLVKDRYSVEYWIDSN
ncbi:MAG: SPOR domain-containing protein [candidate division Zixibacteria bacterium]|nr:SPOR domain-containing protein [candidate division Zixibacteria bacterium]